MGRYGKTSENQIVDKEAGEIIDYDEILRIQRDNIVEDFEQLRSGYKLFNKELDIKIVKVKGIKYPCVTIKKDYTFNKVFRGDLQMLYKEQNLSIHALAFIALFSAYIFFPENHLVINSQNPTMETLCEMLNVKRSKMFAILKELEEKYIIKRAKNGRDLIIYFNPYLFCSGGIVHRDTYKLFEHNPYNPEMYAEPPAQLM